MADEARITSSLQMRAGNIDYQSRPSAFIGDVTGRKGPTPGVLAVSTTGTDVSLAQLTTPGYCRLMNIDLTNYVEWGVHDGVLFHPVGEMLPGESYVIRFSRNLMEEDTLPGTSTTGNVNAFYLRANTASCNVLVEAFES